jgi:hypothetical protein
MDQPWGKKAVRIAIAIGEDADQESSANSSATPS